MNAIEIALRLKAEVGDAMLLFHVGDFYELFGDDATTAARRLGMPLTTRTHNGESVQITGFPSHQLDAYLRKIVALGYRVAVRDPVVD